MKCPNCEATMLKTARHCQDCGAKNPEFDDTHTRIKKLEADIEVLKKAKADPPARSEEDI